MPEDITTKADILSMVSYELNRMDPSCTGDAGLYAKLTELQQVDVTELDAAKFLAEQVEDFLETVISHLQEELETVQSVINLMADAEEAAA